MSIFNPKILSYNSGIIPQISHADSTQVGEEVEAVWSDGQGGPEEGGVDSRRRKTRWVSDVEEIDCP